MKEGRTLQSLATEVERQRNSKADYVISANLLQMDRNGEDHTLGFEAPGGGRSEFKIRDHAHAQLAEFTDIKKSYYDKCRGEPNGLLAENVNYWLAKTPKKRFVRTLDDHVRGVMGGRFRPLDNYDLLEVILPQVQKKNLDIVSCEVTETRLYLKALDRSVEHKVPKVGDIVQKGFVASNSEIGCGKLRLDPFIMKLSCLNGATRKTGGFAALHVGKGLNGDEESFAWFRDDTRRAEDIAFWKKVRDTVEHQLDSLEFEKMLQVMGDASQREIEGDVTKAILVVQDHFNWNEGEKAGVLSHLIKGGDLSQYGLMNAVTRYSQDVPDYDRATEFEYMGMDVVELPKQKWEEIANA